MGRTCGQLGGLACLGTKTIPSLSSQDVTELAKWALALSEQNRSLLVD